MFTKSSKRPQEGKIVTRNRAYILDGEKAQKTSNSMVEFGLVGEELLTLKKPLMFQEFLQIDLVKVWHPLHPLPNPILFPIDYIAQK